jgi:thermitase
VAVTSVDRYAKKSAYANYGLWVDIAAPGDGIRSTFPVSVYANWSGTSMATPFISGQAALIHQLYGSLSSSGIEKKIRNSAQPLTLQNPTYVGMLGAGEANACASL